ncbi:MAG: Mov34/MPN/PAD-1 family protein [Archaeoglobaceae archaeon]
MRIKRELILELIEAAKSSHPHEFVALLSGSKNEINEFIILPFISGESSAIIHLEALPLGIFIHGTVHSHPSPSCKPSEEDLEFFAKYGKYHIIICYPYTEKNWKCYDRNGAEVKLEVV